MHSCDNILFILDSSTKVFRSVSSVGSSLVSSRLSTASGGVQSRVCANPKDLTKEESNLVRRLQEEAARCGGWLRLLPSYEAWQQYSSLYGMHRSTSPSDMTAPNGKHSKPTNLSGSVPDLLSCSTAAIAVATMELVNSRALNYKYDDRTGSTLFHPNLLPPYVNLGMFTGLTEIDPCHSTLNEINRVSEDDGDTAVITLPSALRVFSNFSAPLHSLPPNMLAECLMIVLGYANPEFQLTRDQANQIAACYSKTLGRLPFYHRKLGSVPICVRGVCLVAGCDHVKSKTAKYCGIQVMRDWKNSVTPTPEMKSSPVIEVVDRPTSPLGEMQHPSQPESYLLGTRDIMCMTKIQARNAFSVYLSRIHCRIKDQIRETSPLSERKIKKGEDQIELMLQFLRKAAVNLSAQAVMSICNESDEDIVKEINVCGAFEVPHIDTNLPLKDKRIILAQILDIFICVYMYDTARNCHDGYVSDEKGIDSSKFRKFIHYASENELEMMLAQYTRIHKSVSLFIGPTTESGDLKSDIDESRPTLSTTQESEDVDILQPQMVHKAPLLNPPSLQRTIRSKCFRNLNNKEELVRVAFSKGRNIPQNACLTVSQCNNELETNPTEDFAFVVTKRKESSKGKKQSRPWSAYDRLQRSYSNSTEYPDNPETDVAKTESSTDTLIDPQDLPSSSVLGRFREPLSSLDSVSYLMKPYKPSEYRIGSLPSEVRFQRGPHMETGSMPIECGVLQNNCSCHNTLAQDISTARNCKLPHLVWKT